MTSANTNLVVMHTLPSEQRREESTPCDMTTPVAELAAAMAVTRGRLAIGELESAQASEALGLVEPGAHFADDFRPSRNPARKEHLQAGSDSSMRDSRRAPGENPA